MARYAKHAFVTKVILFLLCCIASVYGMKKDGEFVCLSDIDCKVSFPDVTPRRGRARLNPRRMHRVRKYKPSSRALPPSSLLSSIGQKMKRDSDRDLGLRVRDSLTLPLVLNPLDRTIDVKELQNYLLSVKAIRDLYAEKVKEIGIMFKCSIPDYYYKLEIESVSTSFKLAHLLDNLLMLGYLVIERIRLLRDNVIRSQSVFFVDPETRRDIYKSI